MAEKSTKKTLSYSGTDKMKDALDAVRSCMSVRAAAKQCSVPKSTLHDRVKQNALPGRPPALSSTIEDEVVRTVKEASRQGVGVSLTQLLARTGQLYRKYQVAAFKNVTPSKQWWESLKKRHRDLTIRRPEKLSSARASMLNPAVVQNYMTELGRCITELGLAASPRRIWNCDQTGRNFEHRPLRVISEKGVKNVVGKTSANRTNVTIMACVNTSGETMPPMFIVKGKTAASLHGFNTLAAPNGSKWTFQENGWMNDRIAKMWFTDIFLRKCAEERPQLLLLDAHSSHETLALLQIARENRITILCLPPRTTHLLQPLDRSVFGPFSIAYNTATSHYINENLLNNVSKWSFPGLVKKAWESAFTLSNISNGFRTCGVYPFNASAVPLEGFAPSQPTERPLPAAAVPLTPTTVHIPVPSAASVLPPSASSLPPPSAATVLPPSASSLPQPPAATVLPPSASSLPPQSAATVLPPSASSLPAPSGATLPPPSPTVCIPVPSAAYAPPPSSDLISMEGCPDIESAELLLNLLGDGGVKVEPCSTVSLWDSEIENLFLPTKLSLEPSVNLPTKTKKMTSHRLLTSDEVFQSKQEVQLNKENKEKLKQERALKRERRNQSKLSNLIMNITSSNAASNLVFKSITNNTSNTC